MEELMDYLDEQLIQYDVVGKNIVNILDVGKAVFTDMDSNKSVFRTYKDPETDEEIIQLNTFATKDEMENEDIKMIFFKFGGEWNYVNVDDEDVEFYPLVNLGLSLAPICDFDYVNLGAHTEREVLNGSGSLSHWVKRAKFLGHYYLGVCDTNTMASLLDLQKECDANDIHPVFGYSTILNTGGDGVNFKVYANNDDGRQSMLRIQKIVGVDNAEDPKIDLDDLIKYSAGLTIVIGKQHAEWALKNQKTINIFRESFNEVYFQIDFNEYKADRIDREVLESMKMYFHNIYDKDEVHIEPILLSDCYYVNKHEYKNKITLNKIGLGAAHNQSDEQWYKTIDEHYEQMKPLFDESKWDVEGILKRCADNSIKLAESCDTRFRMDVNYMPEYEMTPDEKEKYGTVINMFDTLLEEGFKELVPKDKEGIYRERLEMEKYVIKSTNNVDYMLNQYDMVNAARRMDILINAGRGSAGGSLVLFLLGVTQVDPIRFDLLFERFILPERAGLYESTVTIIDEVVDDSEEVVEIEFEDGRKITLDSDSQIAVEGAERALYADELEEGQDALFDNIHNLFDIK